MLFVQFTQGESHGTQTLEAFKYFPARHDVHVVAFSQSLQRPESEQLTHDPEFTKNPVPQVRQVELFEQVKQLVNTDEHSLQIYPSK